MRAGTGVITNKTHQRRTLPLPRSHPLRWAGLRSAKIALNVFLLEVAMKVSKFMTRDVKLVTPTQTIRDAARMMAELDAGSLPVQQDDRLVGMITDRDIAVRAVAQGKSPDTLVREVMSDEVLYCFEDQEI